MLIYSAITKHSSKYLRLCLCSDISDHLSLFAIFPIKDPCPGTKHSTRYINQRTLSHFQSLIDSLNWTDVCGERDPSRSYDNIVSALQHSYNTAFPLTTIIKHKKARKAWITKVSITASSKKTGYNTSF